ncbi:hypothetical protein F8388_013147 [Cannabis sativa]|uniref:Uncharacterized protein n=1 Tax=Cannabis sativa TaxID=3483 RepID=A0A7J6HMU5_CANSA|nr:hypothetical protein F8388_013147 [Cannabis sativa]
MDNACEPNPINPFSLRFWDLQNSSSPHITNWIRNIEQHASDNVKKILVGNKADMDESRRIYLMGSDSIIENLMLERSNIRVYNVDKGWKVQKNSVVTDITNWIRNIEQHASDNVKKILDVKFDEGPGLLL